MLKPIMLAIFEHRFLLTVNRIKHFNEAQRISDARDAVNAGLDKD